MAADTHVPSSTMPTSTIELRARHWLAAARSPDGAKWAFRIAVGVSIVIYFVVGRRQWFIRDDWAFIISRNVLRNQFGLDEWLLTAQDGHWMTPPILIYRGIQNLFGISSYWPYLIPTMALHLAAVFMVRALCRRHGVAPWATTILCSVLLVFGGGWENIVFAIQITYNLSLVAFLAQVLLVDHDGRPDRRDAFGAVLGLIAVSSSGFGPFFIIGLTVLLGLRRRWLALAIAVGPQLVAYAWWFFTWQSDLAADAMPGPRSQVPQFVVRGLESSFSSIMVFASLAGIAIIGAAAASMWNGRTWTTRTTLVAMWVTTLAMYAGVGIQRIGFGINSAEASRYQYITAMLLVPAIGLAVDHLRIVTVPLRWATLGVLAAGVVVNAGVLQSAGGDWAARARESQDLFEIVAGSGLAAEVDPNTPPDAFNPDVTVRWLPWIAAEGAITPRPPANDAEVARVREALGLAPTP